MVKRDIIANNSTIYRYLYAIKKNLKVMTTLNPSSKLIHIYC